MREGGEQRGGGRGDEGGWGGGTKGGAGVGGVGTKGCAGRGWGVGYGSMEQELSKQKVCGKGLILRGTAV